MRVQLLVEPRISRLPRKRNTSSSRLKTLSILTLSATSAIKRRSTLASYLANTLSAVAASVNSLNTSASAPCAAWYHLQTLSSKLTMRALPRHKQQLKHSNNHQKSMSESHMAINMKLFSPKTLTTATNGPHSSASRAPNLLLTA